MNPELFLIHQRLNKHTPGDRILTLSNVNAARRIPFVEDHLQRCICGAFFIWKGNKINHTLQAEEVPSEIVGNPFYLGAMLNQHPEYAGSLFAQLVYMTEGNEFLEYAMNHIVSFLASGSGLKPDQAHILASHYIGAPYTLRYPHAPIVGLKSNKAPKGLAPSVDAAGILGPDGNPVPPLQVYELPPMHIDVSKLHLDWGSLAIQDRFKQDFKWIMDTLA